MLQIQQITDAPRQTQTLILPDGTSLSLSLYFRPMQFGWFITELVYGAFVLKELRITNNPNMLYQFKNQIPFGLACFSSQNREPTQQNDFISGASVLYLLTSEEVAEYTELLQNG
jgi:hypothetical protein